MVERKILGVVIAALFALSACGGGGSGVTGPIATPARTPPPPATTVIAQGSSGLDPSSGYTPGPLTTSAAGQLDITVDWTFATNDLDVYLVRGGGGCSAEQFNSRQCEFVALSESVTAKPEKISVSSLAAGAYSLLIINWGPDRESFSYQVMLTTGGTASSTGVQTQAQRQKPGAIELVVGR
jgi:hypothetical protein